MMTQKRPDTTEHVREEKVNPPEHFAAGFNLYKIVWIFTLGSFIGYIIESIFGFILNGHYVNRSSMLYSPFNIIYGVGALTMYLTLRKIEKSKPQVIFMVGMVAGTLVEFLCSWVQEVIFGTVSWSYADMPLNIGGRVCLLFSIYWGLLAIAWVKLLHPLLEKFILWLPNKHGKLITWVIIVVFIIDMAVSALAVTRWTARLDGLPATHALAVWADNTYPDDFMEKVYYNMRFIN